MPKKKTWTLPRVLKKQPSAAAVWLALYEMKLQRGSSLVTPTRAMLAAQANLCEKTISKCLTALDKAGWATVGRDKRKNPDGNWVTLLRIVVHDPFPTSSGSSSSAAAKPKNSKGNGKGHSVTPMSSSAVAGVEFPHSKGHQMGHDSPSERGGPDSATLSLADRSRAEQRSMGDDEDENVNLVIPAANSSSASSQPVPPDLQAIIDMMGSEDAEDGGEAA